MASGTAETAPTILFPPSLPKRAGLISKHARGAARPEPRPTRSPNTARRGRWIAIACAPVTAGPASGIAASSHCMAAPAARSTGAY